MLSRVGVSRLTELTTKIDGFFARVESRHGDAMQCASGCSDCCHVRLTITRVEADAIRAAVAAMPPERRAALADVAHPERCAALDAAGRCKIYEVRPVVCRSHGAPIRIGGAVQSCHRNFADTVPAPDCVLDQTTLSALTLAVDREAGGDGSRVDLAALLAEIAV